MSIGFSVDIKGMEDFFANLDNTTAKSIQTKALAAGADVIATAIRENAPEEATYQSDKSNALPKGLLKRSVVVIRKKAEFAMVVVTIAKAARHVATWLEFGFKHVKKGKFVQRPFFRRSVDESKEAALAAVKTSLAESIQKASKGQRVA